MTRRPRSGGIKSWEANDDVVWVEVEFWSVKKKAALYNHKMSDFAGFVSERLNSCLVLCRAITLKIGKECRTILILANHHLVTTQPQHSVHPGDIRILWHPFFFLEECCGACDVVKTNTNYAKWGFLGDQHRDTAWLRTATRKMITERG